MIPARDCEGGRMYPGIPRGGVCLSGCAGLSIPAKGSPLNRQVLCEYNLSACCGISFNHAAIVY